ncbi:MAG: SAM-dependent methyltransferase [Bacteroidales bacterium]|jgi:16S rRNA (cytidine1402-2'-O)-methyltransferase|nr:SAM-dependent methyltransferase [Bacteroidales bacterium]
MKKGKIYLVPVTLGNEDFNQVIPGPVLSVTRSLRVFAVEDLRSARRYLRLIDRNFPIDDSVFLELNEHTAEENIVHYLDHAMDGSDIGIMSEAGVPGLADPGAKLVAAAHRKKLKVVPLTGPSSIVLALISSGLNGQNFTFNGYLPVKPAERNARLRDLERKAREGYAQIFMETPYRNQKMLESVLQTCSGDTKLCIAADITLPGETISTMTISEWRKNIPSIGGHLVVFILQ